MRVVESVMAVPEADSDAEDRSPAAQVEVEVAQ
jgi:hypothetical protein